jgi:succinoglycan biosynthesis protein ExoO
MTRDGERTLLQAYDIVIAIQDEDRKKLAALCPANTVVTCLPSRANDPVPLAIGRQSRALGFFGGRGRSGPNEQGLAQFLVHAWPRIREAHGTARLAVFGDTREAFKGQSFPGVRFEGFVPDVREAYGRVGVVIAPLLAGGGLKTKVVEALSFGRPVVATTHAAIGYPDAHGHGLLVAQDWRSFAAMTSDLIAEPGRVLDEGRRATEYVETHFGEARVMADLLGVMNDHMQRRRALSARSSSPALAHE